MSTEPDNNSSTETTEAPSLVNTAPAAPPEVAPPAPAPEPLTFEALKLPEGFSIEEAGAKSFVDLMNDDKISTVERAQKLVDLQAQLLSKAAEATHNEWLATQSKWQDEVRADPEIGGAKLEPVLGSIAKLIDNYGGANASAIREAMDLTGAGNNPALIRFLANVAKDLSEGGPVSGAPPQPKESLADRMYPSMKPKQGA